MVLQQYLNGSVDIQLFRSIAHGQYRLSQQQDFSQTEVKYVHFNDNNTTDTKPFVILPLYVPNSKGHLSLQEIINHYFDSFTMTCISERVRETVRKQSACFRQHGRATCRRRFGPIVAPRNGSVG